MNSLAIYEINPVPTLVNKYNYWHHWEIRKSEGGNQSTKDICYANGCERSFLTTLDLSSLILYPGGRRLILICNFVSKYFDVPVDSQVPFCNLEAYFLMVINIFGRTVFLKIKSKIFLKTLLLNSFHLTVFLLFGSELSFLA